MSLRPSPLTLGVAVACATSLVSFACRRAPRTEEAPAILATPLPTPVPGGAGAPPVAAEVQAKVDQIFGGVVHASGDPGTFVAGDFDHDGWSDLAAEVDVKPDRLADMNHELAKWIVQDPVAAEALLEEPRHALPARPQIGAERVVVLINGFDLGGWRSNDARQAYVLKGVAARQLGSMPLADAMKRVEPSLGVAPEGSALVTQVGPQPGIVFFGNGRYTWVPFAAKAAAGKATAARPGAAKPPAR